MSGEELEDLFREPLLLSWEASDGYTVGATKATPERDLLDFDITSSARVGFDHRSLRHALPSRLGKYVIVNNNFCIRYEERKRPVCVRFFKTGDKRFTAFLPDGRHYKSFKLQEP